MLDNSETITQHSCVLKCFCSSDLEPMRGSGSLEVQIGFVTCLISDRKTCPSLEFMRPFHLKIVSNEIFIARKYLLTGAGMNDLGDKNMLAHGLQQIGSSFKSWHSSIWNVQYQKGCVDCILFDKKHLKNIFSTIRILISNEFIQNDL